MADAAKRAGESLSSGPGIGGASVSVRWPFGRGCCRVCSASLARGGTTSALGSANLSCDAVTADASTAPWNSEGGRENASNYHSVCEGGGKREFLLY